MQWAGKWWRFVWPPAVLAVRTMRFPPHHNRLNRRVQNPGSLPTTMAVSYETIMSDIGQQSQRAQRFALTGGAAQLAPLCSFGLTAFASPSGLRLVSISFGTRAVSDSKARVTV
jgi:hypothetical protein